MKISYKINKVFILMMATAAMLVSCEYGDTNNDPSRPTEDIVPVKAIMPIMQTQSHRNITAGLGRLSGIITQQWIGADAQQAGYTTYVIDESDSDAFWDTGIYTGSMRDCVQIIEKTSDIEGVNSRGIAKIYLAANLGMVTDCWGDAPFTEAFKGEENLFPKYDTQESIFESIFRLLDEAVVDLEAEDALPIQGSLVTLTNDQWAKVAYALKARYYIQRTKVDTDAHNKALAAIAKAMSSNADQAQFNFEATVNGGNPLALFGVDRPETMVIDPKFSTFMDGDPRKSKYMVKSGTTDLFYQNDNQDLFWGRFESPSLLMTYAELKFIEAEALERKGQDGTSALKAAVEANMEYIGVSAPSIAVYTSGITLGGSEAADIEAIIIEKYKALYGNTPIEVWNDYKRTGYPNLTPNSEGSNGLNPSGVIPRRFLYPISERVSNPDSYQEAITRQGSHLLDGKTTVFQ
ncbi:SusD/RagB family nutrient-binding outer membrane lipoprotein [Aquimarina aquimarini]|uniref:SusD/RagB family nutrient-binding outer membrane lipoprotein n=1 Tax=Aquimarina aquimarini TaxID=1191734 RepID=UPI000D55ECA5|nr:SusD/RagB family nutrient-binding outer membrane lipoprotein [Aquimarina aquimarini]